MCQEERGCSKRPVQQGRRFVGARSVHKVREHDNGPTYLREAALAKAGNAAGGPFGQTQGMLFQQSLNRIRQLEDREIHHNNNPAD